MFTIERRASFSTGPNCTRQAHPARALNVAGVDFAVVDGEGGCLSVCALPLVSKSENAMEVLCVLRWPLSAGKSVNAAKVRPSNNCHYCVCLPLPPVQRINSLQQ